MLTNTTTGTESVIRRLTPQELQIVSGGQSDERGRIFHTMTPPVGLAVLLTGIGAALVGVGGGKK